MPIPECILARIRTNDVTLTELNLSRQRPSLTNVDMQQLADALENNHTIQSLIFCENDIGDDGAKILARVLPTTRITTLDLSLNQIGDPGARELFSLASLRELDIAVNKITDHAAQTLLENQSLTSLIIDDNPISPTIKEQIERHIYDNLKRMAMQFIATALRMAQELPPEEKAPFREDVHQQVDIELSVDQRHQAKGLF